MTKRIKLRKGLNVNLKGHSEAKTLLLDTAEEYALKPEDFVGMVPKVVVREGDTVKAGDALFVNKNYPDVMFASPVSGTVTAVVRGERRKVLCVKVKADKEQVYVDFRSVRLADFLLRKSRTSCSKLVCSAISISCLMQFQLIPTPLLSPFSYPQCAICHLQATSNTN